MFTRVVNLLTFKMAVFQRGSGGNKDAGSIHLNPTEKLCNPLQLPNLSEPIRTSPDLSVAIPSSPRIWTTKIRTHPRLGEQKSEPIRSYLDLSEPIRAIAFFFRGRLGLSVACLHPAFS